MAKSCNALREKLVECMVKESVCIRDGGHFQDCLKTETVEACADLKKQYFECKRAQVCFCLSNPFIHDN